MREQQGVHTNAVLRAHRPTEQTQNPSSRHPVGPSHGRHPEDRPQRTNEHGPLNRQPAYDDEDDDAIYNTRLPTSTRRYTPATTPPRTIMRVTRHQAPPPSTPRAAPRQTPGQRQQRPGHLHVSVYIGIALLCMLIGWIALTTLAHWWQTQQDTWTYGMPRTFQVDADVRHGGISHFTVENLQGHILISEVSLSDVATAHLYLGPVFSGADANLLPATIRFEDVNGDGYLDMIITMNGEHYVLINDHHAFRPVTPSDKISGKGV